MDDCCAVCAEPLEWVSYGPCFHRDVCSTCVSRLRFICHDRRCCICKTPSDVVFVTKALGDYTRMINDFSSLPSDVREGRVGSYWYHEDTNAFFDDVDHYKMIKAMCRLSCSECDKLEDQPHDPSKRRGMMLRNIEQLKGHLFHRHRLVMCSLCLEGRKVFICEQKLFTRSQLNQHICTGDSEVDGSESDRGGFMGHPMCEFCRTPFYGDNELYTHMSTEHYTCHICQRRHPGQYEYYKNYDDLEIHFRQEHFLCEDEACLAKKFIVFQSEQEMKRHNAVEHGGRMSRSQRNAALQIPTSFRYRHGNEQDRRHGRGRNFHRDFSESQLSMAIEASLEAANAEHMFHDPPTSDTGQVDVHNGNANIDSVQPLESSASSRYLQVLGQNSSGAPLENSSFPPLPKASRKGKQKSKHGSEASSSNSMAAHLRRHRNVSVISSGNAWPAASRGPAQPLSNPTLSRLSTNTAPGVSRNSGKAVINSAPAPSTYASSVQPMQRTARETHDNGGIVHSASAPNIIQSSPVGPSISDFPPVSAAKVRTLAASSRPLLNAKDVRQSSLVAPSISDFPPVSATQVRKLATSSQSSLNAEHVHTANKLLIEKIRSTLDFDEDRYSLFKDFSAQYRQGIIDTPTYLDYVQQFGLSHLVHELARLCPDVQKQKELVECYNASLQKNVILENGSSHTSTHRKNGNISQKSKGKSVDAGVSNPKERLADSFLNTVRQLQLNNNPSEANVEVLSRGDYRTDKGKSKIESSGGQSMVKLGGQSEKLSGSISNQNSEDKGGKNKQRKKTSKFLRSRLGDASAESNLDVENSQTDSDPKTTNGLNSYKNGPGSMPARGVWSNSGGKKLFS
ncbi:PREDICTED: zinc finger protein 598-like [Lupinus angustifolius]|uniref:zinc finger protein 598-like n=1 Tax=Lupinus angustifolius TaxID=3871 RepID=UPI00092E8321|nr:PREDICTED: zinc finger protein 598-like [Lupinus angustifolius]